MIITALIVAHSARSQEENKPKTPQIHGTIRAKYEYQPEDNKGRFEVRTARVSISGNLSDIIGYKAEIDLCDEGQIKMLDAYTLIRPVSGLQFVVGQERVPFTIDAHRSPHQQYFANRSFIAKQVGNVRDVGAEIAYVVPVGIPFNIRAGLFNGSGLTNQKDFWTSNINYSAKAELYPLPFWNVTLSVQKIKPENTAVYMYDAGTYYHRRGLHLEAEYLFKHYDRGTFKNVHAFDSFVSLDIPLRSKLFTSVSPLLRYDFMTDHSDGKRYLNGNVDDAGTLIINDYQRHRITGGVTLSFGKPFVSDVRINYEKYFYRRDGIAKPSEKDKFVIEVMTRF